MKEITERDKSATKRVNFLPKVQISYIPNRSVISNREKRRLWYDSSNLADIEAKNLETLALMTTEKLPDEADGYCKRGLFTRKENRLRSDVVQASRQVVFLIQGQQFDEGYTNEHEISFKYSKAAYVSRLEARNRGVRDESESQNKSFFGRSTSSAPSRRRHSLIGDINTSPTDRYQPRRRISALGHL